MLEGVVLDDRFEIEEIAGRGGMATVYRARDRQTAELVAIKVLHVAGTSDVARFDREARVLDELDHPHIVRSITRGATPDGRVYLALEWLSGETLDQRLAHTLPTAAQALALAGRVASAAAHAHERGIVHRDIKPSNVFLVGPTFEDPRLLDFGVARVLRATRLVTRTGTALGTPAYMAPEQARGRRDVDARADVYALGCLLFECLSGRPPFEGDDVMAVLAKVLFDEPPRLANVVTNIAPALDELVASLMSREPAERPPNAGAVGRLLARVLPEVLREQEIVRGFSSGPPRPLTSREQKLVAIVAAAPPGREPGRGEDAATVEASAAIPSNEFGRVASEFGARFAALADGSCIAVIEAEGSATDLALRAARCALALRALRPSLPFAAVIGRTVSGTLPVGEVIDSVAALLRRAAAHDPPFEVQLDELTASLLEQRFEIAGQDGGHVLRGEREEPRAMRLLLGKPTPCVGRARELRALTQLYEDVARESEATFALVTGAAGMGKSRLLLELVARLGDAQPTPLVWVGRAEPMSAGSPFALAASIVRAAIGASRGERRETVEEKLRARVQARLRGREAERVVEFLAELLGVGLDDTNRGELLAARHDPMLMGDQIARAFEDWLDVEATANPAVIVLEDAHWGDAASVRVIESALRHAKQRPLYVVAVGRPEVAPDFAGLMSLRGAMLVNLGELSRKACAEFVDELLGATITPATREQIVEHAAGNAFFLEELVRFFAERRGESVATGPALPATVLAMLEARLAALPSHARRFVRAASIFGNAFWPAGVAALLGESATEPGTPSSSPSATRRTGPEPPSEPTPSGATRSTRAALDVLLAAEIVERRGVSRFPGIAELVFRHALVRDAAYAMLTDRDRASGHRLAADWLDAAGETESMVLAEHFERGGDGSRAALHLASAAKVALDGQDFASALELAARARKAAGIALTTHGAGELALVESEAHRCRGDLVPAEAAARSAFEQLTPGRPEWFAAAALLATLAGTHSDYRPAVLWRERIARAPVEGDAEAARLLALIAAARRLFQMGDYDAAEEAISFVESERRELGESCADPRVDAELSRLLGARARHAGDVASDLEHYRAALAAYERAGDLRGTCNALVSVGFGYIQIGDYALARQHLEHALADAQRIDLAPVVTRALQNLALVAFAEGRLDDARSMATVVIDQAEQRGDRRFAAWTRIYLSRIECAAGDFERALAEADRALGVLAGTPPAYAGVLAVKALTHLERRPGGRDAVSGGPPGWSSSKNIERRPGGRDAVSGGPPGWSSSNSIEAHEDIEADLAAREAHTILEEYGGIEEFETLVELAYIRAALAIRDLSRARAAASKAELRLRARGAKLAAEEDRRRFFNDVSENRALLELSSELLRSKEHALDAPPESVLAAWSAANFEREAADVTRRLSLHLDVATSGRGQVLRSFPPPDEVLRAVPPGFSTEPQSSLEDVIDLALEGSPWQHHPRYLGHQVASTLPRAALLSLVAAVLNNGMAAFEAGPTTTAMEKRVIEWLLGVVGWPGGGGVLTSGGSLGNLTALLAARQRRAGFDVGAEGLAGHTPLAILVSEQAHYSIERAAQTMGLGRAGVFLVPTDAHYRMRTADLRPTFERARAAGRTPFALVASAGATGTGSIDPLDEVADVAAELGLWLHVDGAHGASMLLSERLRAPLRGIERADSLVWDAHKLMSFPALATAVLFREDRASYGTFAQDAAYLFDGGEPRWFDIGLRTVECTKPLLSVPLYGALASLGTDTFRVVVERLYDLGQHLADLVERSPDFELACRPDCNIVCFRLRSSVGGPSPKDLRDALRQEGSFYTVMTTLRGVPYLRTSIMNPLTTASDLAALLDRLRELIASAGPVDEK